MEPSQAGARHLIPTEEDYALPRGMKSCKAPTPQSLSMSASQLRCEGWSYPPESLTIIGKLLATGKETGVSGHEMQDYQMW
jgi:hypothetical protein